MRVLKDDLKSGRDLFLAGATPDIEKISRLAAKMLDDVHRRHRQASAIDQAGDIALELDVIKAVFAGLNL